MNRAPSRPGSAIPLATTPADAKLMVGKVGKDLKVVADVYRDR